MQLSTKKGFENSELSYLLNFSVSKSMVRLRATLTLVRGGRAKSLLVVRDSGPTGVSPLYPAVPGARGVSVALPI